MLLAVVAGGLNLAAFAPAEAQVSPVANGRRCGFASVTDPTVEGGDTQTGQISAGPLVAAAAGATIVITCTIQVGGANSTHSGADAVSVTTNPSIQVGVLPPTLASYVSPEGFPVYLCTHIVVNGHSWYWDATLDANGAALGWSTSPGATCNEAISQEILPGPLEPVFDILFPLIDEVFEEFITLLEDLDPIFEEIDKLVVDHVDPKICPALQMATGTPADQYPFAIDPDGDVYYDFDGDGVIGPDEWFWDCEPYKPTT